MKRILLSVVAMFAFTAVFTAEAAATLAKHNRQFYGFMLRNETIPGYGYVSGNMDNLQVFDVLYGEDGVNALYAAAAVDNVLYGYEYQYGGNGPVASYFVSFDLDTKRKTIVAPWESPEQALKFQDMTYDVKNQVMYAIGFMYGVTTLYTVDLTTGEFTKKVGLKRIIGTIAASKDGKLYGCTGVGDFCEVNPDNGDVTKLFSTPFKVSHCMEFDHTNELIYLAAENTDSEEYEMSADEQYLICVDVANQKYEVVDQVGVKGTLLGLYIPYVDNDDVPAVPSNVVVTPAADGSRKATIVWKNPTRTFNDDPLTEITSVVIERNGEKIATVATTEVGAQLEYQDNVPADGEYRYVIYAVNSKGDGGKSYKNMYVGADWPDAPENIGVSIGEACKSITLTWDKPSAGYHKGWLDDSSVKYRIVRYPDEVEIAKDLTETTFTDATMRRIGKYYYQIYAVNDKGETADRTASAYILGPNMTLPLTEDFSNYSYFLNQWSYYDGNDDLVTWFGTEVVSPFGYYTFGSSLPGVEYIISPSMPDDGNDADEWLISPPLLFDEGKTYEVVLGTRSIKPETIDITIGDRNTIEAQTQVAGTIAVKRVAPSASGDAWPVTEDALQLPKLSGIQCVGIHLNTPYPSDYSSYLQINTIAIREKDMSGIDAVHSSQFIVHSDAPMYNLAGQRVGAQYKGVVIQNGVKVIRK